MNKTIFTPESDEITAFGRMLSDCYRFPLNTKDEHFKSIDGGAV